MDVSKYLALVLLSFTSSFAFATPFTLNYAVSQVGEKYQYDFQLVLDNNDGSWVRGQSIDWIVFGDSGPTQGGQFKDFQWLAPDEKVGIFNKGWTFGADNGPSLTYDVWYGWRPSVLNRTQTWSITATNFLDAGELYWTNVWGTTVHADFEVAQLQTALDYSIEPPADLPEPVPVALIGVGIAALCASRRLKKL
jgi:hypothetical protein